MLSASSSGTRIANPTLPHALRTRVTLPGLRRCRGRHVPECDRHPPEVVREITMKLHPKGLLAKAWIVCLLAFGGSAVAEEGPIKVGILHSLSGTMAISETTLRDVLL